MFGLPDLQRAARGGALYLVIWSRTRTLLDGQVLTRREVWIINLFYVSLQYTQSREDFEFAILAVGKIQKRADRSFQMFSMAVLWYLPPAEVLLAGLRHFIRSCSFNLYSAIPTTNSITS
jgi:hypothetical protein